MTETEAFRPAAEAERNVGELLEEQESLRERIRSLREDEAQLAIEERQLLLEGREPAAASLRAQRRRLRALVPELEQQLVGLDREIRQAEGVDRIRRALTWTETAHAAREQRIHALRELHAGIIHVFAKLAAYERAQAEVERSGTCAEEAWEEAGLHRFEAKQRVGIQREPPYEVLGEHAHRWIGPLLRHLRSARADFVTWWRL